MNPPDSPQNNAQINDAANALQSLADGPAREASDKIAQGFARAGERISAAMGKAARSGEFSFRRMVESVLRDLARVAISQVIGNTIGNALGKALGGGFSGARADGGLVLPGGSYLVGERGPEVFRPQTAGTIDNSASAAGPVIVNFNLGEGADGESLRRSQGQIASVLARAVEAGRSRL